MARLRELAAIAQAAFRVLPPGHWAEYQPGDGYQVYQLPGQLDAPATIIENATPAPNTAHEWRQAVRLFCWWGDRYGFIRELGPTGAGVVSDPDWRVLSKLLKGAGVLAVIPLPGEKGKATGWAPEWGYTRLHDELGHGPLALPFPTDTDAPKVAYTVPNTTPQTGPTQHGNTKRAMTATNEAAMPTLAVRSARELHDPRYLHWPGCGHRRTLAKELQTCAAGELRRTRRSTSTTITRTSASGCHAFNLGLTAGATTPTMTN